jgi:DNA/RNA endonuclease YhcR with UshA esterase domain
MKLFQHAFLILAVALSGVPQVSGHHAFAAEFDMNRPVALSGKIVKVTWLNPHARFSLRPDGAQGTWDFVLGSPNVLIRQGWSRTTLKEGDVVSVSGYLAKDGSHTAAARVVRTAGGQRLFFGSNGDGGPDK